MKNFRSGRLSPPFLLASFLLLASAFAANAQDLDHARISGRVVDSLGAPVAGAAVVAKLESTGAERSAVTDDRGAFRFLRLEPGAYSLAAARDGFAPRLKTGIAAVAGQSLDFELLLAPLGVEASVDIEGDAEESLVDAIRTLVGGRVAAREIEELPNASRNPLDLVLTLGGTSEEALSTRGLADDRTSAAQPTAPAEQGNFSLSGGASYSNNVTIDGLDDNDDRSANVRFLPSMEMVDEVQVVTNQFSAEYGRASGGRVNLRLRGGTNALRGRVFMFVRDARLNANTWYNNSRGLARVPFAEYTQGFTVGGPLALPRLYDGRGRSFFSVGYENLKLPDATLVDTFVPVAGNPRFPLPEGNAVCRVEVCADSSSTPAAPLAPYRRTFATPNVNHSLTAKFDHKLSDANNFTVGLQLGRRRSERSTAASVSRLDEALQARKADGEAYNFTDNHVFETGAVNQFRAQFSVLRPAFETDAPLSPVVVVAFRNPETGAAQTLTAGNSTASGGNSESFPQNRRETRLQFADTLTLVRGDSSFKFGLDAQAIRSRATDLADATGTFNFANFGAFAANTLARFRQNFGVGSDVRNAYIGIFAANESRPLPGVTMSAGIRWERESAVRDRDNFGPRLGVAWSPLAGTVVRAGLGVFYNRTLLRTVADSIQNANGVVPFDTSSLGTSAADPRRVAVLAAIARRFPRAYASADELRDLVREACAGIAATCGPDAGFVVNAGNAGNPLRSVDDGLKIPRSVQFNVGFEREILAGIAVEANFTLNRTSGLWRDRNVNAPLLPAGYEDWTTYLVANPFVFANSNGTLRTYRFHLGSASNAAPSTAPGGTTACPTAATTDCWVNLNSTSSSTTAPSTAVPGVSTNSVGSALGISLAAVARFRPEPDFEENSRIGSVGRSRFRGLIVEARTRFRQFGRGFGGVFRVNYTLSSTLDDGLNNTANAQVNGDFGSEFARSMQDRRHRMAFAGTFETPAWLGRLRLSPVVRAGSSAPFAIGNGGVDRNLDDLGTDRPNFAGDVASIRWLRPGESDAGLYARFSLPPIGARGGDLPRNAGRGPSFYTFDLGATRDFKLGERLTIRPQVQFDNVLNAAVFNFGAAFVDFTGANFLVPQRTMRQRQIRIGLRVEV